MQDEPENPNPRIAAMNDVCSKQASGIDAGHVPSQRNERRNLIERASDGATNKNWGK
jgi:hypothetical protein